MKGVTRSTDVTNGCGTLLGGSQRVCVSVVKSNIRIVVVTYVALAGEGDWSPSCRPRCNSIAEDIGRVWKTSTSGGFMRRRVAWSRVGRTVVGPW